MDEKALEVAYRLFVKDGYNKSIGDFKTLISTNPKALDVSHKLFVKDGYNGDISKYKNLLGVGELETIGTPEIKKKEQVTELPSKDGSLGSENATKPLPKKGVSLGSEKPKPEAPIPNINDNSYGDVQPKPLEFRPFIKDKPILKPTQQVTPKQDLQNRLKTITPELIGKEEKFVVPELNYQFKDQGFKFEEATPMADAMNVTAPNGKVLKIDLDPFTTSGEVMESNKLKKFISENSIDYDKINKVSQQQSEYKKRFIDQKEIESANQRFNDEIKLFDYELQQLNLLQKGTPEYTKKANELAIAQNKLVSNQKELNKSAGKYVEMKESQGTYLGYLRNQLIGGITGAASGLAGLVLDVSALPDAAKKQAKAFIQPGIRESLDYFKDETTKEYAESLNFVGEAIGGLVQSLPAMLAGEGLPIIMAGQISDGLDQEMKTNPDFENVSELEKLALKTPMIVGGALLEKYGLRNVVQSKGLLNNIVLNAIGKSSKNTTVKSFEDFLEQEIKDKFTRGVLKVGAGGLAEFETGASQELLDITTKDIYNAVKEKKMFQTPETFGEKVGQVFKAGLQEAIGGFILSVPSAISATKGDYTKLNNATIDVLKATGNDATIGQMIETDLKMKVNSGDLTPDEAETQLNDFRESVGVLNSINTEGMTPEQVKRALPIAKKLRDLKNRTDGKVNQTEADKFAINELKVSLDKITNEVKDQTPVADLIDKKVSFQGEEGVIVKDEGGKLTFETPNKIIELQGDEMANAIALPKIEVKGNNVKIDDELFNILSTNKNNNGDVVSVTLRNKEGQVITNKDADLATEISKQFKNKKDAIQEQTTEESVLRNQQPEMGLQEMGKGDTQETPEQGKTEEEVGSVGVGKLKEPTSVTGDDGWTFVRMPDGSYTDGDQTYSSWNELKKVGKDEGLGLKQSSKEREQQQRNEETVQERQDEILNREFKDKLDVWNYINDEALKRMGYESPMDMPKDDLAIHTFLVRKGVEEFEAMQLSTVAEANKIIEKSLPPQAEAAAGGVGSGVGGDVKAVKTIDNGKVIVEDLTNNLKTKEDKVKALTEKLSSINYANVENNIEEFYSTIAERYFNGEERYKEVVHTVLGEYDIARPGITKATEQSLKETPKEEVEQTPAALRDVKEPKAYAEATDAYKSTELGSSENAKNKKQALVEQAETKEGKEFVESQVAQLEKNEDGTITVFRSGTLQDGHNPATTSRKMAETIASERKKQGLSSDIIEVKVNPSDISVVVKGIESEVFVKVDKTNKERLDKNTVQKQKTKSELLTEKGEVQKELEKTKKALADSEKAFNDGTYPFSENVFNDANKKQKAKIKNLEWQLSKINESLLSKEQTKKEEIKPFSIGTKTKFYHATPSKVEGKLTVSNAPQFGTGIYLASDKKTVEGEFGDNVMELELNLSNPVYTNTKNWNEVESEAIRLADEEYGKKNNLTLGEDDTYFRYDPENLSEIDEIPSKHISDAAKKLGYDAIVDKGSRTYGDEIVVLDESKIIYPKPIKKQNNETENENGIQKRGTQGNENVPGKVQGQREKGGEDVNVPESKTKEEVKPTELQIKISSLQDKIETIKKGKEGKSQILQKIADTAIFDLQKKLNTLINKQNEAETKAKAKAKKADVLKGKPKSAVVETAAEKVKEKPVTNPRANKGEDVIWKDVNGKRGQGTVISVSKVGNSFEYEIKTKQGAVTTKKHSEIKKKGIGVLANTIKKYSNLDVLTPRTLILRYFATGGKVLYGTKQQDGALSQTGYAAEDLFGFISKNGRTYSQLYENIMDELQLEDLDQGDFNTMVSEILQGGKQSVYDEIKTYLVGEAKDLDDPINWSYNELLEVVGNENFPNREWVIEQIGEMERAIADELSPSEIDEAYKNIEKYTVDGVIDWDAIANDKEIQQLNNEINEKQDTKTESTASGDSTPISQEENDGQQEIENIKENESNYILTPNKDLPFLSESGNDNYPTKGDLQREEDNSQGYSRSVIGVWNKTKDLQFTGTTKVRNAEDVAHIMRLLENKNVEHGFAVHVDAKGNSHIQYLSVGGTTGTVIDSKLVLAGLAKFKSKKVYLVHNHPSGALVPSKPDISITQTLQSALGKLDIDLEHVIMDTYSNKYVLLDKDADFTVEDRNKDLEDNSNLTVHVFNEQKVISIPQTKVTSSKTAAEFIQQLRFTAMPKNAMLVLSQNNDIIGNYVFKDKITYQECVDFIGKSGIGTSVIFYGNQQRESEAREVSDFLKKMSVNVLDHIITDSNGSDVAGYYRSLSEEGMLEETQAEYGTNSVVGFIEDNLVKELPISKQKELSEQKIKELAAKIRSKKLSGLGVHLDFGITKTIYNGALEIAAREVEKGSKLGNAINKAIAWVDSKIGKKWNKGLFARHLNDKFKMTVNGSEVEVQRDETKPTAELINGFYSPLEAGINKSKLDKATGKEWLKRLQGETESDELKWTGVADYLTENSDKIISKNNLLDYFKTNRIEIVEVVKSDAMDKSKFKAEQTASGNWDVFHENTLARVVYKDEASTAQEAIDIIIEEADMDYQGEFGDSKFSEKQLEGEKSNYKEVLVMTPVTEREKTINEKDKKTLADYVNGIRELNEFYANNKRFNDITAEDDLDYVYIQYVDERNNDILKKIAFDDIVEITKSKKAAKEYIEKRSKFIKPIDTIVMSTKANTIGSFSSSHFDEPNILVHLRMNTRTDAQGNKVLFLEEIQSDWGQKGKKEGFKGIAPKKKISLGQIAKQVIGRLDETNAMLDLIDGDYDSFIKIAKFQLPEYADHINLDMAKYIKNNGVAAYEGKYKPTEFVDVYEEGDVFNDKTVPPSAPFVMDTNAWTKLALKVALKEAIKQGADKIAWTTGEQQNDRYDLSKSVKRVDFIKVGEDRYKYEALDLNSKRIAFDDNGTTSLKDIENMFGKDIAEKVKADKKGDLRLEGEGLKVGGKGMKGFYGSPTEGKLGIVGEVARSLTGQSPKTIEINKGKNEKLKAYQYDGTQDVSGMMGRDYLKKGDWIIETPSGFQMSFDTKSKEDALREFRDAAEDTGSNVGEYSESTQYSIDITPELKESVESGIPLFKGLTPKEQSKQRIEAAKKAFIEKSKNMSSGGFQALPEFVELIKSYIADGIITAKEFIERFKDELPGVDLNEKLAVTQFDKIYKKATTVVDETTEEVKKTIATSRVYEGNVRAGVKRELEKLGLTRDVENQQEAKERAIEFVNTVGVETALEAVRNNDVSDAAGAYVWNEILERLDRKISKEKDSTKLAELEKEQAGLFNEFSRKALSGGRFSSALADIYQNSDIGYNVENKIQEYRDANNGQISEEVEEKFRELDAQYKEVKQKLAEAEERAIKAEGELAIKNIQEAAARTPKQKVTVSSKIRTETDWIVSRVKEAQLNRPGMFLSATPASLVWDGAVKIVAGTIKVTGRSAEAIAKGLEHIVKSDWYKSLSDSDKKEAEKQFSEFWVNKETIPGIAIKIPNGLIRRLVEEGATTIEEVVEGVKDVIKEEYPDITDREIRDAITQYGKIKNLSKDEILASIRKIKRIGRIVSALEDVNNKKRPLRSGLQRDKLDAQERALNKELRELMKELPIDAELEAKQQKTALDATKQRITNQIEDLQREIDKGMRVPLSKRSMAEDAELTNLKEKRDKLKIKHDEIFKDESFLQAKRLDATKKASQRAINDLRRRLKEKDFTKKEKSPLIKDSELFNLQAEKLRLREEYDKEIYKAKLNNRTKAEKTIDALWNAWGLTRLLRATGEFSFVGIQGLVLSISNPTYALKSFMTAMKFFGSESRTENWLNMIKSQEWYPEMRQSKLSISEPRGEATAREELFLSDAANFVWNILGSALKLKSKSAYDNWKRKSPFKAFERAAVGYLDTMRVLKFLDGREMLHERGIRFENDPQAFKDLADVVNTFTGRASIGPLEQIAPTLTKVFFSPRNWASALKQTILFPRQLYKWRNKSGTPGVSIANKIALLDYSKFIGLTMGLVIAAAMYYNDDDDDETGVETDPTSSDFGKIKIGNTRVDPWGGRIQQIVFLARMIAGSMLKGSGEVVKLGTPYRAPTRLGLIGEQATNKLAPSASMIQKFLTTHEKNGVTVDQWGNPYSITEELKKNSYPIYWDTVKDLLQDDPTALDGLLAFYAFFGGGVNVYDKKTKPLSNRPIKELKELKEVQEVKGL